LHCDVALAAIVEGAHAGETEEMAEDVDDGVDVGWLLPPQAVRQRRTEDTTTPHAS
jgi:hypothetical protein